MRMALEWEFCKQFSTKRSKKRTPEPRYDVLPMDLENEFVITDNGEGGAGRSLHRDSFPYNLLLA